MYRVFKLFCVLGIFCFQHVMAHSHTTYIVEQAPPPTIIQVPSTSVIVVQNEPPAKIVEQTDASPGPDYVWVQGDWKWDGRWVWGKGNWQRKPHEAAVWTPGHWKRHHHHHSWEWIEGHWN